MSDDFVSSVLVPSSTRKGPYILGSIAIGIAIGTLTNVLGEQSIWLSVAAILLCLVLAAILWRRKFTFKLTTSEGEYLKKYKALVTPVSTIGIIETLIEHHGNALEHLWLISNYADEPHDYFKRTQLPELKTRKNLKFVPHHRHYKDYIESNLESAYQATVECMNEAIHELNLNPENVIVDITSGTKEMTAGVVLACVEHGWAMSYVRSDYMWDDEKKCTVRIQGSEKILKVYVDYARTQAVSK